MAKVLIIRKTDKTIHQVPLENKATLMAFSNRLPANQRWVFEEIDEKEAKKLPFIDPEYVTASEAMVKVKELEGASAEKDSKIEELLAKLALLEKGSGAPKLTALEAISKIELATTAQEVTDLLGDDDRKTVQDAAAKKIATFS